MMIPGGQIGEIADKGKLKEKQYQAVDTDDLEYCWLHNLNLKSDWRIPSIEDQIRLNRIRLVPGTVIGKDGKTHKYRYCPKCHQIVYYTKEP